MKSLRKVGQVQMVKYRREIDGLRAVAVLPVLWFHTGFVGFPGGFLGVDVFFVISGFLITGILLSEIESGTFSILGFYERRARRILPALFVVVLTTIPFAWVLLDPPAFADYSRSIAAVTIFVSNVHFWENVNYFGLNVEQMPLLHTWSLAVEEQFYLAFPLVLLLVRRKLWAVKVAFFIVLAALSLSLSEWGWRNEPDVNFFFTFSRVWELLAGAIAAAIARHVQPRENGVLAMAGLAFILGSMVIFDEATPVPSIYALVPVLGSVLVLLFGQSGTLVARLLSLRWMVGVGLVSYSAYLWHYPFFAFAHVAFPNGPHPSLILALLTLNLAMAALTWVYVEQPFRRRKNRLLNSRGSLFAVSGAIGAGLFSFGLIGDFKDGFVWRFYTPQQQALIEELRQSHHPEISELDCILSRDAAKLTDLASGCVEAGREVLIWGDSHSAVLSTGLRQIASLSQLSAAACAPVLSYSDRRLPACMRQNATLLEVVSRTAPNYVILHANWLRYNFNELSGFGDTLDAIKGATPDVEIVVIGGTPQWFPSLPALLVDFDDPLSSRRKLRTKSLEALRLHDSYIRKEAELRGVKFVSILDVLCDSDSCLATVPNSGQTGFAPLIFDADHLTRAGSEYVAEVILKGQLQN